MAGASVSDGSRLLGCLLVWLRLSRDLTVIRLGEMLGLNAGLTPAAVKE
jgi:hypothetical protein